MVALQLIGGLILLVVGAELLVRGAAQLAAALGTPTLIIGLTVVAFGTSAPELAVSLDAALAGEAEISVGNVVGSNIFNVLLILGLSALVCPLLVSRQLIRFDLPVMIGAAVLALLLSWDGQISRADGLLLFAGILAYVGYLIHLSRKSPSREESRNADETPIPANNWLFDVVLVVVGLGLLILGSRWLVVSAVAIAQQLGVSELIIGLTIVAAGTSLPELLTSVVASLRGERDIAVGNIVGSNIFNVLAVLGLSASVAPGGIAVAPAVISFDIPIMIAISVACLPIFYTGGIIARWEGALLVAYYLVYTLYLILNATHDSTLPLLTSAMIYFIIPLTVVTLLATTVKAMRTSRGEGQMVLESR